MFFWKNKEQKKVKKKLNRRFIGARSANNNRFNVSYNRINADLKSDYIALVTRARSLVQNNETVNSYINLMLRSVLGNTGFILNCTAYNDDGTSDRIANQQIENLWYEYNKSYKKFVSADCQQNGLDFDRQVLFTYLVDGEVFIRKIRDSKSKFGIRFEVIDSLDIDTLYNADLGNGEKICMGIKVDQHYKPLSYFVRKNRNIDYYTAGQREQVKASEIIHVFQRRFAGQVRGYPLLSSVLLSLSAIEEYKRCEIDASIINSAFMGIWEQTNSAADAYDQYDDEIDENGDVATQLEANSFRFAPRGFKLSQITNNHPNSNVATFFKTMLKGVAGALGMSYNKISSDFESTSYSSLRQSNMQDSVTVKEIQQFIIDNWKDLQYAEWLKYLLLTDLTNLPCKIDKFLSHDFQGRNFEYLDPQKEMQAINMRLSLGLSSPIEEITNLGKDPIDVLNSWSKWHEMLKQRGLQISNTMQLLENTDSIDENSTIED